MAHPYITIDPDKIEHNAGVIVRLCRAHGIDVTDKRWGNIYRRSAGRKYPTA